METFDASAEGIIGNNKYLTSIQVSGHEVLSDENIENGGGNKGPNPFGLLASSLVACTCITLKMYSEKKGWDLGGIKVKVEIQSNKEKRMATFYRGIAFEKTPSPEQVKRLLAIANKCPVHSMLSSMITIITAHITEPAQPLEVGG